MFLASNPQSVEPIKQNLGLSNSNISMNELAKKIIEKIRE
jgi:DNA-binding transcriptional regulator GbsR (MarR family)